MKKSTDLQLRKLDLEDQEREIRGRLNAAQAPATPDQAEIDRLSTEYREAQAKLTQCSTEYRDALREEADAESTETTADAETRERLALRDRSRVSGFLLAHLQGREPIGAEAEYRSALGFGSGIPLDLWETDRPVETRADAASGPPATGSGATLAPIQPFIFAPSIAPRLGIEMPTVGSGAYSEATITTSLTAAAKAKGAAQESTAATLTPATANPRRISARLTIQLEDIASVGQANFEAALRQNLSMALSDAYDSEAIAGTGVAPHVAGLIKQLTDPTDPTAVADFAAFLAAFSDSIDGLFASMLSEIAIVANVDAYKLSCKTFRDKEIDETAKAALSLGDVSFADYARERTGGWWTNKRMPASASNIAKAIVYRMGQPGIRLACHPTWGTVQIDDIFTDSAKGQKHVTLHVMVGDKVLLVQPGAYAQVEFKVA